MATIDDTIYGRVQPIDLAGDVERGLNIRSMIDKKKQADKTQKENDALQSAARNSFVKGPDGKMTFDQNKFAQTASSDPNVNPIQANQFGQQIKNQDYQNQTNDLKLHKQKVETGLSLLAGASPQTWNQTIQAGIKEGVLQPGEAPAQYDQNWVKQHQMGLLSVKDQMEAADRSRGLDIQKQKANATEHLAQSKFDENKATKVDKLAKDLRKDLDPDMSRAGNFGQISAKYIAGQRMKTLVNAFDGGNLPPQQMEELALGMANMISGSSGTARSQVEALVPSSAMGNAQAFKQWFMNQPTGANQQKFVQMMSHTVDREMGLANQQLNDIRKKRLSAHGRLKNIAPDQYNNILKEYGMNPDGSPLQENDDSGPSVPAQSASPQSGPAQGAYQPPKIGTSVVHGGITYVATPQGWAPQTPDQQAAR